MSVWKTLWQKCQMESCDSPLGDTYADLRPRWQLHRGEEEEEASTWPRPRFSGPAIKSKCALVASVNGPENKVSRRWEEVIMSHGRSVTPLSTRQTRQTPRGEIYNSRCLLFIARARQPCLFSAIWLRGSLKRVACRRGEGKGTIWELEPQRSNAPLSVLEKKNILGSCTLKKNPTKNTRC